MNPSGPPRGTLCTEGRVRARARARDAHTRQMRSPQDCPHRDEHFWNNIFLNHEQHKYTTKETHRHIHNHTKLYIKHKLF